MAQSSLSRIKKVSNIVRGLIIFVAALHLLTFVIAMGFSQPGQTAREVNLQQGDATIFANVTPDDSDLDLAEALTAEGFNAMAILSTPDVLIFALLYYFLFQLFSLYRQGHIFDPANINSIRNIGRTLLFWVPLSVFYPVLAVLFIRFTELSETLAVQLTFNSTDVIHLLLGLVIYVIAWIMAEATKLHEEQALVI